MNTPFESHLPAIAKKMISNSITEMTYDVCVIGTGPAGIIFALEYTKAKPNSKVLLVEYGTPNQPQKNGLDDSIQVKSLLNHHDPYECTNKGLGGTSATWGGRCVMYDEIDFLPRDVVGDDCTWDVSLFHELKTYVPRTCEYFECGEPAFNLHESSKHKEGHIAEKFVEGDVTDSVVERWSMPTRFGPRYAADIEARPNLTLVQGYEARNLGTVTQDGEVSSITLREVSSGKTQDVKAKKFVIAAGAQESTRLLLRSQQIFDNLGATPDSLGKYYQSHLSGKIASIKFNGDSKKTDYGFLRDDDGTYLRRRFQFSTAFLKQNNLLNTAIWLDNPLYFNPAHKSGAMSMMYLAMIMPVIGKRLAPPAIAHSITKGKVTGLPQHIGNIIRGIPGSLLTPAEIFYKRYLLKRKLPGVFLFSPQNRYALHFHSEQIPVESNTMTLGPDGETLVINYELVDDDIRSVIETHAALDKWLRDCGCGELEYWFKPEELTTAIREMSRDGIHQSGTTRIADSPTKGVVDSDLKVWGTNNVFVCSSSTFPTSSQANPTFFMGAFAVRLAAHIAKTT